MNNFLRKSQLFVKRNSATILSCVGGVGVVGTAVLAVQATPKALRKLDAATEEKGEALTKLEVVKVAGPSYIPAVVTGAATIACIFGANALNKRQQAALMSAYALLDNYYKEYKKKVIELYGSDSDERIRGEIAKDKYVEEDIKDEDDGKQLFYDEYSQRYFRSTTADVLRAEYNMNHRLQTFWGAYLNDFYDMLEIPRVDYGDYLGWSNAEIYDTTWEAWLDFHHEKVVMDDGLECTIITMSAEPTFRFEDY
jgi:hypothetical protein